MSAIQKNGKFGTKEAWPRSRDLLLNISGTAKARNLKFGVQIDYDECYSKNAKLGDKIGVA